MIPLPVSITDIYKKSSLSEIKEVPRARYDVPEYPLNELRFDLRRVILPGCASDTLLFNATLKEINWWLLRQHRLKTKGIKSPVDGIDPVWFYETIAVNATK